MLKLKLGSEIHAEFQCTVNRNLFNSTDHLNHFDIINTVKPLRQTSLKIYFKTFFVVLTANRAVCNQVQQSSAGISDIGGTIWPFLIKVFAIDLLFS